MDQNVAYIRRVCQAKAAELAGDRTAALVFLAEVESLTGNPDDLMQIAKWRKRLEEVFSLTAVEPQKRRKARS